MSTARKYPHPNRSSAEVTDGSAWSRPHLAHVRVQGMAGHNDLSDTANISHQLEQQRKDDFLSMASHELKTPITTLKAFLQLVSSSDGPEAIVSKVHLKKMVEQVDRLTRLVSDLLEVSKIQKGEIEFAQEIVDVDPLVQEMLADARIRHPSHSFSLMGTAGCKVQGDRDRLGQAITELLNNAVKFSPGNEEVEVRVSCAGDKLDLTVSDHGIGMLPADQDHIFERYYRVLKDPAKPFPGLGVGLYIVSEIVKHHDGNIAVSSVAGEGSAFTISLPISVECEQ